jgi:hypothetical protein
MTKIGFVSDGIQGLALRAQIQDVPRHEVDAFDEVDATVGWAKE